MISNICIHAQIGAVPGKKPSSYTFSYFPILRGGYLKLKSIVITLKIRYIKKMPHEFFQIRRGELCAHTPAHTQ